MSRPSTKAFAKANDDKIKLVLAQSALACCGLWITCHPHWMLLVLQQLRPGEARATDVCVKQESGRTAGRPARLLLNGALVTKA
jgi:hypothetical protein